MNRDDLLAIVREELAVAAPDVPVDVPETAAFRSDLEVDSLAILEFVARLEYRFSLAVPDEAWPQLTSIAAVVDYLADAQVTA